MADTGFDPEDPRQRKSSKPQPPRVRMSRGVMSWIGFVLVALMIAVVLNSEYTTPNSISIDKFWDEAKDGAYKTVIVSDDAILGTYKPEKVPKKGMIRFKVAYRVGDQFDQVVKRVQDTAPAGTEIRY